MALKFQFINLAMADEISFTSNSEIYFAGQVSSDSKNRKMLVAQLALLPTWSAKPKGLATVQSRFVGTPNRPKISKQEAKVL